MNEPAEQPFDLDGLIARLTPAEREHLIEYGLLGEPVERERVIARAAQSGQEYSL